MSDPNDASVSVELTDRNTHLRRIYVRGHTFPNCVNSTEHFVRSVNHADLSVIFVQAHNVSALLSLSPKLPTLKIIVAIGEISAAPKELLDAWSKQREIRVMTLTERKYLFERFHIRYSCYKLSGRDWHQVSYRTANGYVGNGCNDLLHICASSGMVGRDREFTCFRGQQVIQKVLF